MNTNTTERKSKSVEVALDSDDLARLDDMVNTKKAKGEKISRASLIRRAVKDYLNKNTNSISIGG